MLPDYRNIFTTKAKNKSIPKTYSMCVFQVWSKGGDCALVKTLEKGGKGSYNVL